MLFFPLLADSVVFYSGEAEVFKSLKLKGGDRFEIAGIPADAYRIRLWTSSGLILSYSLKDTTLPTDPKEYDSLKAILRSLKYELKKVESKYERLKYEKELLLSYVNKENKEPVKNLMALSSKIEENSLSMYNLSEVEDSLKALLKVVKSKLERAESRQKILRVTLKDFKGGYISISYGVRAAWSPAYVFRVSPNSGKFQLEAVARISNSSSLPIRTDRAVVTTSSPPPLSPPKHQRWILRTFRPFFKREGKSVAAVQSEGLERTFTYVSTRYEYSGKIEVPEKNRASAQIELFKKVYDADLLTFIYPEIGRKAYVSAVFTPDEDLAPGDAKVYMDGELTADFNYDGGRRGSPDTLFVGYDPFITGWVKLVSQKRKDEKKGKRLFTLENRIEDIGVKNGRKRNVRVIVYARKPFAEGDVNVLKVRFDPKPKRDMGEGLMMWEVDLKPSEVFKIKREIDLEYPKGEKVVNW